MQLEARQFGLDQELQNQTRPRQDSFYSNPSLSWTVCFCSAPGPVSLPHLSLNSQVFKCRDVSNLENYFGVMN